MKNIIFTLLLFLLGTASAQQQLTVILDDKPTENVVVILNSVRLDTSNAQGKINIPATVDFAALEFVHLPSQTVYKAQLSSHQNLELYSYSIETVIIKAVANTNLPYAQSVLNAINLEKQNLGKDLPVLLDMLPGTVVSSDAGNGVGYTDLRIRGTDGTRTNVTINGVPINDAESQSTYWVNMPDMASSASAIEVQRGAGTSVNGAGAFGATINILTQSAEKAFGTAATTFGSFGTSKNTIALGTGWLRNTWNIDLRLSQIKSNGFIDRSQSNLSSYMLGISYKQNDLSIKYLSFGGTEQSNQAWYGVPIEKYRDTGLRNHYNRNLGTVYTSTQDSANLFGSTAHQYNYYLYPNEIDKYSQLHNHMYINKTFNSYANLAITLYNTAGKGYFEQFRNNTAVSNYGYAPAVIGTDTISHSKVVRQRWLDNNLLGINMAYVWQKNKSNLVLGLGANTYQGNHYGKLIWANAIPSLQPNKTYYNGTGAKSDATIFAKWNEQISLKFKVFADLQLRAISHTAAGLDNDLRPVNFTMQHVFFNPKIGASYVFHPKTQLYYSYSIAHKEPSRSDFTDNKGLVKPQPEVLYDHEIGLRYVRGKLILHSNVYGMFYKNQLILTGAVNDVGSALRQNVPNSYRIGIENAIEYSIHKRIKLSANACLSYNKIKRFTTIWLDYNDYSQISQIQNNRDIALSPRVVGMASVQWQALQNLEISYMHKYVSKQYLDNTQNAIRSLPQFSNGQVLINYVLAHGQMKKLLLQLQVSNLFNTQYASRGYTFGYYYTPASFSQEVYVFPQAGRAVQAGIKMEF